MDFNALTVVLWQVCLIEAIICLILLVSIILATGRWRLAIRRAVSGVGRGAVARARVEAAAEARKEAEARARAEEAEARREAEARADRGPGAFRRFSSAVAAYATHLRRGASAVPGIPGHIISPLTKRSKRVAGIPERFSSQMAEYAEHLKNHNGAIHSLSKASQDLKEEVSRHHRILSDLISAMEQAPARVEPEAEAEEEAEGWIPGHFRYRGQPAEEPEIAAEEAPARKPSLATRHTLATREAIASKGHLISSS